MKDFAAIDFETANNERSSVCSVGIVIVRNGDIRVVIWRIAFGVYRLSGALFFHGFHPSVGTDVDCAVGV